MAARGRPKKDINYEHLRSLLKSGLSKAKVARILNISRPTLDSVIFFKSLSAFSNPTEIMNDEIDELCRKAKIELPSFGERMVIGYFRACDIKVTRKRIRESIHRVDPDGVEARRELANKRIKRRIYHSPYPHYIWHIDGNHKLIRWRMVIHIGIDGFSRACIFMKCSDNNKSVTVLDCFRQGIEEFSVSPTRVRSDHGGENVLVWETILSSCSDVTNIKPVVVGSSVHNQRVERFNREVNRHIRDKYASIFYELEGAGTLDVYDYIDIFCLHYVYLPLVNKSLSILRLSHNNHSINSEHNETPMQRATGFAGLRNGHGALHISDSSLTIQTLDHYGSVTSFQLQSVENPLTHEKFQLMCQHIDPILLMGK